MDAQEHPLLKAKFIVRIKDIIESAGYPSRQFAGHSFRIAVAKMAAQARREDSMIQTLSHWNSTAFSAYIRTPKEKLAAISSQLASISRS